MTGVLKAIVGFLPNLIAHHEQKPLSQSSETWVGLVGVAGTLAESFHLVQPGDWDKAIAPALVYAISRIISKGLKAPAPSAAS